MLRRFSSRSGALALVLAVVMAVAVAGCGSSSSGSGSGSSGSGQTRTIGTVHAVVGFVAHAGLAFGAFKIFIYNPYRAGRLNLHHPFTDAKALAAALFAFHEVRKAADEIRGNPRLSHLFAPFTALAASLSSLRHGITGGNPGAAISGVNGQIGNLGSQAAAAGSPISAATSGFHF